MMNFHLRKHTPITDSQKMTSKDKISYLYSQINTDNSSHQTKSSYNLPCSDQKLVLLDIMKSNKIDHQQLKPTDINAKLKEAKRNLIYNTKDDSNRYLLTNENKLSKFPKTFQEKYRELAKCAGTEMKPAKYRHTNSSVDIRHYTPSTPIALTTESKASRLKKEIMSSMNTEKSMSPFNMNQFLNFKGKQLLYY